MKEGKQTTKPGRRPAAAKSAPQVSAPVQSAGSLDVQTYPLPAHFDLKPPADGRVDIYDNRTGMGIAIPVEAYPSVARALMVFAPIALPDDLIAKAKDAVTTARRGLADQAWEKAATSKPAAKPGRKAAAKSAPVPAAAIVEGAAASKPEAAPAAQAPTPKVEAAPAPAPVAKTKASKAPAAKKPGRASAKGKESETAWLAELPASLDVSDRIKLTKTQVSMDPKKPYRVIGPAKPNSKQTTTAYTIEIDGKAAGHVLAQEKDKFVILSPQLLPNSKSIHKGLRPSAQRLEILLKFAAA